MADVPAPNYDQGFASLEIGDTNATSGLGENYASIGKIAEDSFKIMQEDHKITEHFAEGESDPYAVSVQDGKVPIEVDVLDISADNMVTLFGGTATDVADSEDEWTPPANHTVITKALKVTLEEGTVIEFFRCRILAKLDITPTQKGRAIVKLRAIPMVSLVDGVAPFRVIDKSVTNTT